MIIKCTASEQMLIKQSIKRDACTKLCNYKDECTKPKDMTCGEYIVSMITWEVEDE